MQFVQHDHARLGSCGGFETGVLAESIVEPNGTPWRCMLLHHRVTEGLTLLVAENSPSFLGVEYRYYDHPRPGSIYTAPDILNVVRGPTLVRVRDRREPMRVPLR